MISICPLLAAGASPFTAERTKRVVNPEVPFARGRCAALASALRAASAFPHCNANASGNQPMPLAIAQGLQIQELIPALRDSPAS